MAIETGSEAAPHRASAAHPPVPAAPPPLTEKQPVPHHTLPPSPGVRREVEDPGQFL
jgi:hypothetical protein